MYWIKIFYTKTRFVEPEPIEIIQYYVLKTRIENSPTYQIDGEDETFAEHFKVILIVIGISLSGELLVGKFGELFDKFISRDHTWATVVFIVMLMLFMIGIISGLINLLLEAPSFITYKRKKREYYQRMKSAIEQTENYDDFVNTFYH